jgi:hypothetical protein
MPSLLETLLAQGVERKDNKRLTAMLRPMPIKQRDVFDFIVAQGREPSFQGIVRSVELKGADPRTLIYVTLGRWPTAAEIDALPDPYKAKHHLRDLLGSLEFRQSFVRRLLDAFPDRRRLLHVRIPRCGGNNAMETAAIRHPIMPRDMADNPDMDLADVLGAIGGALYRFNSASTVVLSSPRLRPYIAPEQAPTSDLDPLHWNLSPPPCRVGDTLFATIREPRSLLISLVNAILSGLRGTPCGQEQAVAPWRKRLETLPAENQTGAWKDIGRRIARDLTLTNPICTALGDGTAQAAIDACRATPIDLVGLARQTDWIRTAFDSEPAEPSHRSESVLTWEDLAADDMTRLDTLIAEDRIFHDRFQARFDPSQVSSIKGADL